MKQIGLFEAKTNLSKIAETVNRTGQAVTLTRRGQPYVDLVPHHAVKIDDKSRAQLFAEIDEMRKKLPKITRAQIKELITEGRRH